MPYSKGDYVTEKDFTKERKPFFEGDLIAVQESNGGYVVGEYRNGNGAEAKPWETHVVRLKDKGCRKATISAIRTLKEEKTK